MSPKNTGKPGSSNRGKATPTAAAQRLSAQRSAAARERIAAAQRKRRMMTAVASVVVVLVVVAVLIIVKVTTDAGGPKSGKKATSASSTIISKVESVPAATFDSIGVGAASALPMPVTAPDLTSGGKPEVFYAGAEYCPYCAAERWAVSVALSRFGKLSGVGQTTSSPSDVYPSTATLTFHGATYTSQYLTFAAKELQSNQVVNGQYAPLDTLDKQQTALLKKYNAPPYLKQAGGIPFIDIGGKYLVSSAGYNPGTLQGKTHAQIADAIADPSSAIAKGVDGTANTLTAAFCKLTGGKPGAVCTSKGVSAAAAVLASNSK